jgi:hypothetical protein
MAADRCDTRPPNPELASILPAIGGKSTHVRGKEPSCYLSAGNARVNHHVGLLFISFEARRRLRLNGIASQSEDDPLRGEWPEAQFVWRVQATEVFGNCPRIHHYELVERSRFVPRADCETPAPAWKSRDWARDVLPAGDPSTIPSREILEH